MGGVGLVPTREEVLPALCSVMLAMLAMLLTDSARCILDTCVEGRREERSKVSIRFVLNTHTHTHTNLCLVSGSLSSGKSHLSPCLLPNLSLCSQLCGEGGHLCPTTRQLFLPHPLLFSQLL